MRSSTEERRARGNDLPGEIYVSLVDSLFHDMSSMLAGAICATAAAMMTAWKTGDPSLWGSAFGILLIGVGRAIQMWSYARAPRPLTVEAAGRWEFRYTVGAAGYTGMMGLWCFFGIALTNDPTVHLLCSSVTVANIAAGASRVSGRPLIAALTILCACVPLALALLLRNDIYYAGFAAFIVLFFAGLTRITLSLHQTNLKALVASREVASLAGRFDTALNNMPHGLCMCDADGRVVVTNSRLVELLGLSPEIARGGATLREVLLDGVRTGTMSRPGVERVIAHFERHRSDPANGDPMVEIQADRTLAFTFQGMPQGGSVVIVEDITERKNTEAKINRMARYDALTGLLNRVSFRDQLDNALGVMRRRGESFAVLFIDLDQFKEVNDTLGHPCGDQLLCAVSDRLRAIMRPSDVVARFGGDEFIVFQSPIGGPDDAAFAGKIVEALKEPYEIDHHRVVIGASVGIATDAFGAVSADHLLKYADMALYRAKADGRNTWRFFEPEMAERAQSRRSLELDLRNAMAKEAFELYYQPLLNLKTKRISTCEALIRWPHPERGMISPADFIPLAEEMGLIVDLGRWTLRQACIEATRWPEKVRVAVNLSPIQFRRGDVVADVRDALAASGLAANRLELEITESVLMQDTQTTRAALHRLRDDGVRISLDDFGTGYSSLSYLHKFPLQKVKIDRSFLVGVGGHPPVALLRGVARLVADLGMSVVVEGVETDEQLTLIMAEETVDEAQGYLFSRPIPARALRTLLKAAIPYIRKVA